jgi:hypothetical protein
MNRQDILNYYSRQDIQNQIMGFAKDREVVGSLQDGTYLKRPDILAYPKDLIERVRQGVVSLHCSVEKWFNPMQLSPNMNQQEIESLRMNFDLIMDIDSKYRLEHAAVATDVLYYYLKDLGIKATIKFSGSRGFHIGISGDAFPEAIDFKKINKLYPKLPQTISEFLSEKIKDKLLEELIAREGGVAALVKTAESISELSPYEFVNIERNWGNRHLFRMPYSLHSKTWLVSIPVRREMLYKFDTDLAKPEKVKINADFLLNFKGEADQLILAALDWKAKQPKQIIRETRIPRTRNPVPETYFPPCIKQILNGLKDGKKRSLFTLLTFLKTVNWPDDEIESRIKEWNLKNISPLPERLINTQIKWHLRQIRNLMPPNSDSDLFYKSIGIMHDPSVCGKNPANDAFRIYRNQNLKKGLKT